MSGHRPTIPARLRTVLARPRSQRGFTLVEVMLVVSITGVVVAALSAWSIATMSA